MQALTAIAATVYAVTLWMFAPESVWQKEVDQAKRNQNRRRQTTPPEIKPDCEREIIPEQLSESTHTPNLEPTPATVPTAEQSISDAIPDAISNAIPDAIPTPPETATVPTPEPMTETEEPTPQPEAEPESIPEAITQLDATPQGTDYTHWTTAKLREEAKSRKLQWRPLINGKRKPLNKPQLIELLTA